MKAPLLLAASCLCLGTVLAAGASPGTAKSSKEDKKPDAASPSSEERSIRSAILIHIADRMKKSDGGYPVIDPRSTETVTLWFEKFLPGVETGKKGDVWSVSVEFADAKGEKFLLDFFVTRKKGSDQYSVVESRVKSVNGKEIVESDPKKK